MTLPFAPDFCRMEVLERALDGIPLGLESATEINLLESQLIIYTADDCCVLQSCVICNNHHECDNWLSVPLSLVSVVSTIVR